MSYRSFCSLVLQRGTPQTGGSEPAACGGQSSPSTKMTSIVQITNDDLIVAPEVDDEDPSRDGFSVKGERCDFFDRNNDFLSDVGDSGVTCATSLSVTSRLPDENENKEKFIVSCKEMNPTELSHCEETSEKVLATSANGVIQVVSDKNNYDHGNLQSRSLENGKVSFVPNSDDFVVSPSKITVGNTTKVYLNAEENEETENGSFLSLTISINGVDSSEGMPTVCKDMKDEKAEMSETESETKTETSETESETKTSGILSIHEIKITDAKDMNNTDDDEIKHEVPLPTESISPNEFSRVDLKDSEEIHGKQTEDALIPPPTGGDNCVLETSVEETADKSCRNEALLLDGEGLKEDSHGGGMILAHMMVTSEVENRELLSPSEELKESLYETDTSTPLTSIDSLMNDIDDGVLSEMKEMKRVSFSESIEPKVNDSKKDPPFFQKIVSDSFVNESLAEENCSLNDQIEDSRLISSASATDSKIDSRKFSEAHSDSVIQFAALEIANIERKPSKAASEHEANALETVEFPEAQESFFPVREFPEGLATFKESDGRVFSNTSVSQSELSANAAKAVVTTQTAQEACMAPVHTVSDGKQACTAQKQCQTDLTQLQTIPSVESTVDEISKPDIQLEIVQISEPSQPSDDDSEHAPVVKRSFTTILFKEGEVDAASILEQKQSTKQYWENKMAATAAPSEDLGWEPVANVCFRDPNAPLETANTEDCAPEASAGTDFLPAPPPQFDNTPPASIEETKENNHKLEQERIISLDDEISVLEREVLGEVVASDIEEDIEEISETRQLIEETVKTNHKYVYGEEGAQEEVTPKISTVVQNRRGDPDRLPTVKSTYNATQGKENVIEAEIRAQQERERELKLEQMKKQQILQQNMQNSNKTELMRHNGASSPHDSDEGFVDPPVERPKLEATAKQTVSVVCSDSGYAHVVTDHDGESVIYDAVAPPKSASPRPLPEAPASSPSPVPPKSAPKSPPAAPVPHTTETKIALEIRELKEREEELRRMREARQGVKKIQNGCSVNAEEHEEDFNEVDIEDTEDRGSSSSREILDDHLTSLTTTTDEGNFSECGDATSSEDKSSNGSNSRIMSPEVPGGEYPRPSRRVTVRPFQADDDDDRLVYTRMKNESVIEREIRIAKERDEAYKKEKGLLNGAPAPSKSTAATTNGVTKHASLRQSVSLSAVANGSNKGTQHQLATSRIQLEIAENGQRERELMSAGKVLTLSEDTVDDKVTRLSDLADLPTAQEVRTKSPTSTSRSSSTHQSPTISPHSTLSNSSRSSNNGLSNGFTNGHHFSGSTMNRLTKSLSTTNLSSPQSSLSSTNTGMRPKGLIEKFIASRGKMTPSAFTSPPPVGGSSGRVVATRPMRVQPKKPVLLRQHSSDSTDGSSSSQLALELRPDVRSGPSPPPPHLYKRVVGAEEKIQEELREMQQREEELKRLRSKNLAARSQPNLLEMSLNEIPFEDDQGSTTAEDETDTATETEDSADTVMRAAVSIPNLVDDISENGSVKKVNRRRSALIAEWENRIQSTAAVDA